MGKITSYKQLTDVSVVEDICQKNNLDVRYCNGSHRIIKDNNTGETQCYYEHGNHQISTGVAHALYKWFLKLGLLILFLTIPFFCLIPIALEKGLIWIKF